ncbi:uncharacterized protein N7482_007510 [Penicillium canariense]|uniref:glucan 1,3-beta-glucosidase n=1 Tax=Penicillium canariense TaxID=189055 RepID=A0A9W9HZK4_9EURO|nr:uncharacterized protein N7482_007510 [Penicillium canariense]KAJ5160506.1 hypothetical protein N7482_007510 [Penicillium canariense]
MHDMRAFSLLAILSSLHPSTSSPVSSAPHSQSLDSNAHDKAYTNWRTLTGHGVNLGGWLEQESTIDTAWWSTVAGNASDEWTICANLGPSCAPVFERRYATYITRADIDTLAGAGVSILRIPTTYAAWVRVPGSQLYAGNQQAHLRRIAEYAIATHGMHVVIDIHSLPGGTNGLDIGEAVGHRGWWHNETALEWSLRAVDALIAFVQASPHAHRYTIEPINEPADNPDFAAFGTPAALSEAGAAWLLKYFRAVIQRVEAVNPRIPVMLQGSFKTESYWAPHFDAGANIVFDLHHYYWQYANSTSANLPAFLCADARASAGDGKFPTFVGEWAMETGKANDLTLRTRNLVAGLSAFAQFTRGSAYWNAKFESNVSVAGQEGVRGVKQDYWNFEALIRHGLPEGDVQVKAYCQ